MKHKNEAQVPGLQKKFHGIQPPTETTNACSSKIDLEPQTTKSLSRHLKISKQPVRWDWTRFCSLRIRRQEMTELG